MALPRPDGPILRAVALAKHYKDVHAVAGIDLDVHAGARVALLGPNGAGKTTTLLMLLGAVRPDHGTVEICGHLLPRHRSQAMAHVGFVAGYLPLPEKLRVHETLRVFAGFYGIRAPAPIIEEMLDRFGITHLADRMSNELSSGQRTLVGIVKAVLHRPELLVLDEPTASLDPEVALRARTGLLDINRVDGTALLVTSHNMVEVERLCDRVIFIAAGRIVADGRPEEVVARFGRADLEGVFLQLAGEESA